MAREGQVAAVPLKQAGGVGKANGADIDASQDTRAAPFHDDPGGGLFRNMSASQGRQ
jgi:hypothetical protein